ncbi:MAG: AI-2E family transporter [Lachnospiraceae bacterium]|nr:AI-2E family transporter [Lachnospiraceae bacterium]
MHTHPLFRQLFIISLITGCVLLSFRYILPVIFPFLTAYALMRFLRPVMFALKKNLHFPGWLAGSTTLLLFGGLLLCVLLLLCQMISHQIKLLVTNVSIYRQMYTDILNDSCNQVCNGMDYYLGLKQGSSLDFISEKLQKIRLDSADQFYQNACTTAMRCMGSSLRCLTFVLIVAVSMIVLCKDMSELHRIVRKNQFFLVFSHIGHTMWDTGLAYLRSQAVIILCNWLICSAALMLIHNPYSVLIGLFIAVFDAFPILGSGMILIPWGIYYLIKSNFFFAAILLTTYLLSVFAREFLEAKLLGDHMGTLPFFTLASIYIGLNLYGFFGIFLGPLAVVLVRAIYEIWMEGVPDTT